MLSNNWFATKYHDSSMGGKVSYDKNAAKSWLVYQCRSCTCVHYGHYW